MLDALRRGARGFTAKILLGLLIVSFAVWGVSSAFLHQGGNAVIEAGETVVTTNEYRLAYDRALSQMQQQFGRALTAEQAEQLGVGQAVVAELSNGAVLDEQTRALDLGISTDELAGLIAEDPAFRGPDGSFDRSRVPFVLRNVGLTEEDYLESQAQVARRRQLLSAVGADALVPLAFAEARAALVSQSRDVSFVTLDDTVLEPPADPDDEALAEFFEGRIATYRAPEYRDIAYVRVSAEALADPTAVSDDEVRAAYEADPDRFVVPEARDVESLLFPSREEAEAALARLRAGEATFEELIAERGTTSGAITLRGTTPDTYPDPGARDAAFALAEGEVSDVVDGRFGPVLLRAARVLEAERRDLAAAADEIRAELAAEDAAARLINVVEDMEDALAGGASLAEVAEREGLEVVAVGKVDASGADEEGEPVALPPGVALLDEAFEVPEGADHPPLDDDAGGFVFYDVASIEAARDRTLDEVRERAIEDYRQRELAGALSTRAAELDERLRGGETLEAIAEEIGRPVERAFDIRQGGRNVSPALVEAAFAGPEGHTVLTPDASGAYRLVRIDGIVRVAGAEAAAPQASEEDLLLQFVDDLQRRYRPTFNPELARQVRARGY